MTHRQNLIIKLYSTNLQMCYFYTKMKYVFFREEQTLRMSEDKVLMRIFGQTSGCNRTVEIIVWTEHVARM